MAKKLDSITKISKRAVTMSEPTVPESEPQIVDAEVELIQEEQPKVKTVKDEVKETKDTFESLFPEPSVVVSGPPAWIWWLLLILGAIGLGFLAFQVSKNRIDQWLGLPPTTTTEVITPTPSSSSTQTATPTTPTSTPIATATPTANISKSTITLRVLNGTTKTGAAAAAKTTLETAGFSVRTTGNANNQNYATTTIYYQAGRSEEAVLVKEGLGNQNAILEESTLANPDMVLVVIGTK